MHPQFNETAYMIGFKKIKRKFTILFDKNDGSKMLIIYKLYNK